MYYSPPTVLLPMAVLRLIMRKRLVLHVMDLRPDILFPSGFDPSGSVARIADKVASWLWRASYSLSAEVTYVSPSAVAVLECRDVAPSKPTYAPVWTDEQVFTPRDRPSSTNLLASEAATVLVYGDTIGAAQGLEVPVEAMAVVGDLPLTCLIAGDVTARAVLADWIKDLGLPKVQLLGTIDRPLCPILWLSATCT